MLQISNHLEFARLRQTYLEAWPDTLRKLSIRQTGFQLSLQECKALGSHLPRYRTWFSPTPCLPLTSLEQRLVQALEDYPLGAMVRLGSRSAKDSPFAQRYGLQIFNAREALDLLTSGSRRLALDLKQHLDHYSLPHLFVREWQTIPAWAEFRCFIHERKLIGLSQYDTRNHSPFKEILSQAQAIEGALRHFCEQLLPALHLTSVVADVFLLVVDQGWRPANGVGLLELNPFFRRTDPCLFSWRNGGDFDGSFRYLRL